MSDAEAARVTTFVAVTPEVAFEVFTEEIDLWWRRGARFRSRDRSGAVAVEGAVEGELRFERDAEGHRLVEILPSGSFELGRARVWEPGARLVLDYRLRNFAAGESTELEIRFEPFASGTRVVLEHRGWQHIRSDHPARHGLSGGAFGTMIGGFWGDLLTAYRQHSGQRS